MIASTTPVDLLSHVDQLPIHALIVSAGSGSRFGANLPKQYLSVAGRTVLEHSAACLNVAEIHDLTLVIAKDDTFAPSLAFDFGKPIYFIEGGLERFLSVKAGVESICKRTDADAWVLIHDGARPCLSRNDLSKLVQTARMLEQQDRSDVVSKAVGAILATPVVDTLKLANNHGGIHHESGYRIDKTISREGLWQAQTPQIFRLHALQTMLDKVVSHQMMITDEASGFEQFGDSVLLVQGSRSNIKLTYPDDLMLIELMLASTHHLT